MVHFRRLLRRPIFVVVALAIVAAACASTALVINNNAAARDDDPSLTVPPASSATTVAPHFARHPSVTTTTEPLPQPQAPPSDPYAPVNLTQIGTITIPKIGLVHPIFEGITLTVIDHGPG